MVPRLVDVGGALRCEQKKDRQRCIEQAVVLVVGVREKERRASQKTRRYGLVGRDDVGTEADR